jgi:hypothetical protein
MHSKQSKTVPTHALKPQNVTETSKDLPSGTSRAPDSVLGCSSPSEAIPTTAPDSFGLPNVFQRITGWFCTCYVGARTVGTCSHVASVIWYLGIGRYEPKKITKSWTSMFQDVPKESRPVRKASKTTKLKLGSKNSKTQKQKYQTSKTLPSTVSISSKRARRARYSVSVSESASTSDMPDLFSSENEFHGPDEVSTTRTVTRSQDQSLASQQKVSRDLTRYFPSDMTQLSPSETDEYSYIRPPLTDTATSSLRNLNRVSQDDSSDQISFIRATSTPAGTFTSPESSKIPNPQSDNPRKLQPRRQRQSRSSKDAERPTKDHVQSLSGRKRMFPFPDITIEVESDFSENSVSTPKYKGK